MVITPKSNSLIAYNLLKERIVDPGFCTQCGACEAACPVGALHIDKEKIKRTFDCSKYMDLCPLCYEICPHSEALLLRSLGYVADAPVKSEALGYYRKIALVQAVDPKIRELSHGGGVVTSLLNFGIERKIFDSVIVCQGDIESPLEPKPSVAVVPDDILSAIGSKFFPCAVARAYGSAVYGYEKTNIGFVGIPCHVLAIRKLEAWQHKISGNLKITIGIFCFGTLSFGALLEHLKNKYHIEPSQIKQIHLTSKLIIQTDTNEIRISFQEVSDQMLPSCQKCTDFTNELADISVGGAYPLKDWSTVIIRSKAGEEFFYKAIENGAINSWVIQEEPSVIEWVMLSSIQKRSSGLRKAKEMEKTIGHLPALLLRETDAFVDIKIRDVMTTKNIKIVKEKATVRQFLRMVARHYHFGYPLVSESNEPIGWVTLEEASSVEKAKRNETFVGQIARRKLVTAFPDETALEAFKRMSKNETGRLVIVERADPKRLVGIITKTDLMHILTMQ